LVAEVPNRFFGSLVTTPAELNEILQYELEVGVRTHTEKTTAVVCSVRAPSAIVVRVVWVILKINDMSKVGMATQAFTVWRRGK
jgi:hypothetical protein